MPLIKKDRFLSQYKMSTSTDSEPIYMGEAPSDMMPVAAAALSTIPWKLLGSIFVIFMFLSNDVFLERILGKVEGCVGYGGVTTTKGTIVIGILLVVLTAIANALIEKKVL